MLEIIESQSGDVTFRLDNKLLASRIDPTKEANKWVDKHVDSLRGLKTVIVIGIGAGYHLIAIKQQFPHIEVIAIEENSEIIDFHRQSLDLNRYGIQILPYSSKLFESESLLQALKSSYLVLVHASAKISFKANTIALKDEINGRTAEGLQRLLQIRGLQAKKIPQQQPISYFDIEFLFEEKNIETNSGVQNIIGELIK